MIKSKLIDMRNWFELKDQLIAEIASSGLIGFDIETEDSQRHEGLNQFMKVDTEGHKSKGKRLVFDVNRTVICGFSWYCDESDTAYYLNLAHADVENRIPWSEARQLLDARAPDAHWICHNAPFEITMMMKSLGYEMTNVICTLQLAVSAFNEDQYPEDKMFSCGFGGMRNMLPAIAEAFAEMDPYGDLTEKQSDLLGKIIGKTTSSSFSYNALVSDMTYGYGLKKLTKSLFGYEQATFDETLNGKAHMGQITGDECCAYGADDAYWALRIFHRLLPMLPYQNDQLMSTFFEQENPMIYVFADIWMNGMRINLDAVHERRQVERETYAEKVVELQALVRDMLPFPDEPNQWLMNESWYGKTSGKTYRSRIEAWAKRDLPADPFDIAYTTAGAVSNAWAEEQGKPKSKGPNFSHYMMMRTLMYDLPGIKPIYSGGKVASDKGAREKLQKRNEKVAPLLKLINEMAGIEQRMKLYLTPYLQLCDPETQRVYPVVSSQLNSRRMAASFPNPMQLAKRGESTYIRGFYLPDEEDHVIVSIDWSQIELVLIGDFSDDEGFREAYGQLPFKDLHTKAVGDMFGTSDPKSLPNFKDLRTKVGKGANFNYWYSGALSTVGDAMGWSSDKMWEMTEAYRETFAQAEEWRVDLINEARDKGFVTLPDGHRRHKFEASYAWQKLWRDRWQSTTEVGLHNFGDLFVRKLTNRAANQIVNSMIQGSCATLAKRSILAIRRLHNQFRFRFMIPIHDELVFSVHRDDAVEFIKAAKAAMCDHPEIIKTLAVDATASVGRTFEPYHPERAPMGQIELDEAPTLPGWLPAETKDQRLDEEQIQQVIHYLFEEQQYAIAA
ncbi:DNA polymerase [Epibacterium sp. MM17-32]|uniref:DNA polymerase n=1 Tax=Epibacterium sp. MM17-32 TaxID=2917734 RepID=UPI001EF6D690|nr:DNA polymerase [Epibacterium sp. MM17-32]MCG7628952.1 DNA polymerase [Epibacterium sp. MM17-32]